MKYAVFLLALMLFLGCVLLPKGPAGTESANTGSDAVQGALPGSDSEAVAGYEQSASVTDTHPETPGSADTSEDSGSQTGPLLESEKISYPSAGGWTIHGTMYESSAKNPKKLIVLLHQLGSDRSSYPEDFILSLHERIPDAMVLAIDMRGHGESTNLKTWNDFDTFDFRNMKNDVLDAKKDLFPKYPTLENIYVVGASIGSTAAINAAAQDKSIIRVAMISPGTEYKGVNIENEVESYNKQLLIAVAYEDAYSFLSANTIASESSSQMTYKIYYDHSEHGTELFEATEGGDKSLSSLLVDFLD